MDWMEVFTIISTGMVALCAVIYCLVAYWNIKFLLYTKWQFYSINKLLIAILAIFYVIIFSYSFYNYVTTNNIEISFFSAAFLRPTTLLMGGVLASCARNRLIALQHGGEQWILRKS